MIKKILVGILAIVLIGVSACAKQRPDADAVAAAIEGTRTALASEATPPPTATNSPTATRQPTETASPSATNTLEPSATPTRQPTETPSPTATRVALPEGWNRYENIGGDFSVGYPSDWTVADERGHEVAFDGVGRYAGISVGAYRNDCEYEELDPLLRCLATEDMDIYSSRDTLRLVETGVWEDGANEGYFVHVTKKDYVYENWSGNLFIHFLCAHGQISVQYWRVGTTTVSEEEMELIRQFTSTLIMPPECHEPARGTGL